jgi:hypothetical protein
MALLVALFGAAGTDAIQIHQHADGPGVAEQRNETSREVIAVRSQYGLLSGVDSNSRPPSASCTEDGSRTSPGMMVTSAGSGRSFVAPRFST